MHVKQKSDSDCVLAAIAMAAGKTWEDLWTQDDLDKVIKGKGISDWDHWLDRAGLKRATAYGIHARHHDQGFVKAMLAGRRALLSVCSLNTSGGYHAVYWDGAQLHDPQAGRKGRVAFKHLSSICVSTIHLL